MADSIAGLVKKNIGKTDTSSKELSALMLAKAPANLKAEAEGLEQRRATAFQKTVATYEGASGGENDAEGDVSGLNKLLSVRVATADMT